MLPAMAMRVGEAGPLQPGGKIGDERVLAAVKMRAAADIEQQAVGRVDGDQRRVAQAPVGDFFEQAARRPRRLPHRGSAGCMARACASARPGAGRAAPPPRRRRRSVRHCRACHRRRAEQRPHATSLDAVGREPRSHRLSMRCEEEALIAVTPSSRIRGGRGGCARGARADAAGRGHAGCCAEAPRRRSSASRRWRARPPARRAAAAPARRCRRRRAKPPQRHRIDRAAAPFADHRANGAAAQRFLHRPQQIALARGGDRHAAARAQGRRRRGRARKARRFRRAPCPRRSRGRHLSPRAGRGLPRT